MAYMLVGLVLILLASMVARNTNDDSEGEVIVDEGNKEKGERAVTTFPNAAPVDFGIASNLPVAVRNFDWATPYDPLIFYYCYNTFRILDPVIVKAIMRQESNFDPYAQRSEPKINDASIGLMQILVKTARWMNQTPNKPFDEMRDLLLNPAFNIATACKYLAYLSARYGPMREPKSLVKIVAAYNAGSAIYKKSAPTVFVNQSYVDSVLRFAGYYMDDFPSMDV